MRFPQQLTRSLQQEHARYAVGGAATLIVLLGVGIYSSPDLAAARVPASASYDTNANARRSASDNVGALFNRAQKIIAIHNREASPYLEAVLWLDDETYPDVLDLSEVAVVSHSRILQTITLYSFSDTAEVSAIGDRSSFTISEAAQASFCDHWRSSPDVTAHLLASGVSDMTVGRVETDDADGAMLRIRLTWPPDSTDTPMVTEQLVAANLPAVHVKE